MSEIKREICINLTRRCNLKCPGCYVSALLYHENKKGEMDISLEKIKEILDLSTFDNVYLTGGEPFAHPDIRNILDYFSSNGKAIYIATNGLLLTNDWFIYLTNKKIKLLISLRNEHHNRTYQIINKLADLGIDIECYHLPTDLSPTLLLDFINVCPSVNKIKLLYDSKNPPKASDWFSLLAKIEKAIADISRNIEITVEVGFLPKQNQLALDDRRGAIDRIQISTEGEFYSCPLLVLNGEGKKTPPPEKCTKGKCPVLSKDLDEDELCGVCPFLVTTLQDAILIAKWAGISLPKYKS